MKHLAILMLIPALVFSLKVSYFFQSSHLVLNIEGEDTTYRVRIDGETYKATKTLRVPWEKGKVEEVEITGEETGERVGVLVKGIQDFAPRVQLKVSKIMGNDEVFLNPIITDDWDPATSLHPKCFVDSIPSSCTVIDPLFLDPGEHTFELRVKDSFGNTAVELRKFTYDATPPGVPSMRFVAPDSVLFPDAPRLKFYFPDMGTLEKVVALKRDRGYVVAQVDDAGNEGEVFVIPPIPSDLTPFPSKAITSVTRSFIFLSSDSPYSVVGKVLLPSGRSIVLSGRVELTTIPTAELIVKGILESAGDGVRIIGGGGLRVEEKGELYLENAEITVKTSFYGGRVVYLNSVRTNADLRFDDTWFVVLKNMKLDNLECRRCRGLFLQDSTVTNLKVHNTEIVRIKSSKVENLRLDGFVKGEIRDSVLGSVMVSVLSRLDVFSSDIGDLIVDKASRVRLRDSRIKRAMVNWFSRLEYHRTDVGEIKTKEMAEVLKK